ERVGAQGGRYAASGGFGVGRKGGVSYVVSGTQLVRLQKVGTDNLPIFFRHQHLVVWRDPVAYCFGTVPIPWKCVGLTRTDNGFQDVPLRIRVAVVRRSDFHPIILHGAWVQARG